MGEGQTKWSEETAKKVKTHLKDIHKRRSPISCASVLLAIEVILYLQAKKKHADDLRNASSELKQKFDEMKGHRKISPDERKRVMGEMAVLQNQVAEKRNLVVQASRIRLNYVKEDESTNQLNPRLVYIDSKKDKMSESGTVSVPEYIISIPESLREVILDKDCPENDVWDDDTKSAKTQLRKRTAHELAHLLYWYIEREEEKPFPVDHKESKEEEEFVECFETLFTKQPIAWIEGIHYPLDKLLEELHLVHQ